jgi:subtilisin-like proprotein convertase family protein/Ca2+-binding EF-hand superfamily protein
MRKIVHPSQALALIALTVLPVSQADGQDNPDRSSADRRTEYFIGMMRRMDANRNGYLEQREISSRARPYVDRVARSAGLNPSGSLSIRAMEEAMRRSSGTRDSGRPPSGSARTTQPATPSEQPVPGFGQVDNLPPILGFGEDAEIMANVEQADLDRATERMRQYDRNRDGFVDRDEARSGRWRDDPFQFDRNNDNRLSRIELAQRYARRRESETTSSGSRDDDERRRREEEESRRRREEEQRRRQTYGNRETWGLVESLMRRYDQNRDGRLDQTEVRNMGPGNEATDSNSDGRVDRVELYRWINDQRAASGPPLPEGLPDWFGPRDVDGDGQVMMSEFSEDWSEDTAVEFASYDANNDGIITVEECLEAARHRAGTFGNTEFQVIPARGTIYSKILVQDDRPIADLDVQLSITHTHDDYLDVFLVDPAGERIELFTGVGGSDDHFENTILDDEASVPIVRARPPFSGRYQPEAFVKRQRSLSNYRDSSIEGTWTLMVRAERSDRAGALHGWALIAPPVEKNDESPEEETRDDRPDDEERRDFGPDYRQESASRERYGDRDSSQPWRFGDRREEYRRGPPRSFGPRGRN